MKRGRQRDHRYRGRERREHRNGTYGLGDLFTLLPELEAATAG